MFWQDLSERLHLSEIQYMLMDGHPPLAFKLIGINSIFIILFLVRRMRKQGLNKQFMTPLHWTLVFANLILLCQNNLAPYLSGLNRFF